MPLSREEIEQIATTTAQAVLVNLARYPIAYEEPPTIEQGLRDSMAEEGTASNWYHKRATHARDRHDEKTAQLYEHIAGEEDKHFDEFNQRLLESHNFVQRVKFQNSVDDTPYKSGELAGMQMDTIPEALENLHLAFTEKQVTISPWLSGNNTYDLYWVDAQGNFIKSLSSSDREDFEKGLRDWLRPSIKGTKQIWPPKS